MPQSPYSLLYVLNTDYVYTTRIIYYSPRGTHPFKNKTQNSPARQRGSNSKTKVFRDLGPKPPIPLAFGSPSHATAAQCAEEGGSAG